MRESLKEIRLADRLSLTPCFSGVFVAGLDVVTALAVSARSKPLKRLRDISTHGTPC
jgi:hypothetical protein